MALAFVAVTLALLAYTYFGYPILIGLCARLFPVKWSDAPDDVPSPSITVCLPVFNGGSYLPAKVASLLAQDYPIESIEILIYCDGCTDDTETIARAVAASAEARGRVRVLVSPDRRGKPTALNTMAAAATGDLLLMNDVRQPLSGGSLSRAGARHARPARRLCHRESGPGRPGWQRRLLALRELDARAGVGVPRCGRHDRPARDDEARRLRRRCPRI